MKKFALTYTEFEISQYEVIHYIFSPCPEPSTIVALYTEFNANATEIINVASEYNCRSILFSLRTIVESIPDKWIFCLAENDTISFTIASENCKIKIYTKQISYFKKVANRFKIKYDILSADRGYSLITIKEPSFDTAKLPKKDPNQLLKDIITDIQGNIDHKILHSINGIVSVINSTYKSANSHELYERFIGRLMFDESIERFFNHDQFATYLFNKALKMRNTF